MAERALVLVKQDGVERGLIGRILTKFEEAGLKVVASKMVRPTTAQAAEHYNKDKAWIMMVGERNLRTRIEKGIKSKETAVEIGTKVHQELIKSLSGVPIAAFVIEGNAVNDVGRKIAGATEPRKADPSTIRGTFSSDTYDAADAGKRPIRNLVHVSETSADSAREIKIWFGEKEILTYRRADENLL